MAAKSKTLIVHGSNGTKWEVQVPPRIFRLHTAGAWQVRYKDYDGTLVSAYFRDSQYVGFLDSLKAAEKRLRQLLKERPPYPRHRLHSKELANKKKPLGAVGISGPLVRYRTGHKNPYMIYQVFLPQVHGRHRVASVYLGTPSTYTLAGDLKGFTKAKAMRAAAEDHYLAQRRT